MKSYSNIISSAAELPVLVVPIGPRLPVDPKDGSLFHLSDDYPEPISGELPWYSKGLYRAQDGKWIKLVDQHARPGHGAIGAQTIEIEVASSPKIEPVLGEGYVLSAAVVTPVHRKILVTGSASFWAEAERDCNCWATVFRETEPFIYGYEDLPEGSPEGAEPEPIMRNYVLVGLVGFKLPALTAVPVSLNFVDYPATDKLVTYVLQVNADAATFLSINECSTFRFNGMSASALIVNQTP